jgi:hypothetical protein
MTADRVDRPQFTLSREFLAIMLGETAAVVSEVTDRLERSGAFVYRGNAVTVLDGDVLHDAACECYDISKAAFAASPCM